MCKQGKTEKLILEKSRTLMGEEYVYRLLECRCGSRKPEKPCTLAGEGYAHCPLEGCRFYSLQVGPRNGRLQNFSDVARHYPEAVGLLELLFAGCVLPESVAEVLEELLSG